MTTNQTFAISFIARTNRKDSKNCDIYARITIEGKRTEFSITKSIPKDSWNSSKEKVDSRYKDFRKVNAYIDQVRSKIVDSYRQLSLSNELLSPQILKNHFFGFTDNGKTLLELIEYHNKSQTCVLSHGTLKNYFTTKKYVIKYLHEKEYIEDITLSKLNYQFITKFEAYLRNYVPTDHQRPLSNNGVMKHLERLRKMTTMAVKLEWIEKDPFSRYKLSFKRTERTYLTEKELKVIVNKNFNNQRMEFTKDMFVFACYTGLAYIDVIKLQPENINIGIDGEYWITTKRKKTEVDLNIPLLPIALGLINKYKDHPRSLHHNSVFPRISNQKLNSYLKEVADVCGINKSLTFHIARHTFATTVTLSNGVPIETVSKVLGHTKLSTTMIYARVLKNKISEDMNTLKATLQEKESKPIKRKKYNT